MSRADYWQLILRICDDANDDTITSLRIALLNTFAVDEQSFSPRNSLHLAKCLRSFLTVCKAKSGPVIQPHLPLILFPYATGSNMLNLLPVAREAQDRGLLGALVAGEVPPEQLVGLGSVITTRSLRNRVGVRCLPAILRQVRKKWSRLTALVGAHDARCGARVRRNYGWFFGLMIESERMRIAFQQLLTACRPSCVISTSDYWPLEFQLFCQAKRLGIPNAMIQHGEFTDVIAWPTYADTFLVWGEIYRDKLLGLGAPPHRLRVCGMPAADDSLRRFHQTAARPVSPNPVCLVFSHAHDRFDDPELFREFAEYLRQAVRSTPGVRWKIKLHPAENDSFYQEIGLVANGQVEILPKSVSLDAAVDGADVACTIRSTAGLQAMMMQKPVIVVDLKTRLGPSIWWLQHGGGLSAPTAEKFKALLDCLLTDRSFHASSLESQSKFLEKTFANPGRAAAGIVDYLEEQTCARRRVLSC